MLTLRLQLYTGESPWSSLKLGPFVNMESIVSAGTRPKRPKEPGTHDQEVPMSDALWEVVQRCWAQDPQQRPSSRLIFEKLSVILGWKGSNGMISESVSPT